MLLRSVVEKGKFVEEMQDQLIFGLNVELNVLKPGRSVIYTLALPTS